MKKILCLLLLVLTLSLASCKKDAETFALVDNPDAAIIEGLGLSNITKSINPELSTASGTYIDVKVKEDLAASLVTYNIPVYDVINEYGSRITKVSINALAFVTGIDETYQNQIMAELHNSAYGITKENLGLSVDIINDDNFATPISTEKAFEFYEAGETDLYISVIYLPVRALICTDNQNVLGAYVFIPVYAECTTYSNNVYSNELFASYTLIPYSVSDNNVIYVQNN